MRAVPRGASQDQVVDAVNDLATGASNAVGTLTLAAGSTVTDVRDPLCTAKARVFLAPRSASAAAAGAWIVSAAPGVFRVSHAMAPAGCVFDYEIRRGET